MRCLSAGLCALLALSAPSLACTSQPAQCALDGESIATLHGSDENGVLFSEIRSEGAADIEHYSLVECEGRSGLSVNMTALGFSDRTRTQDILTEALTSGSGFTPRKIARTLRFQGITAEMMTLPDAHCGCDLPGIVVPAPSCPESG